MNSISRWLVLIMVVAGILGCGTVAAAGEYVLGPGDVLAISVWGHDELAISKSVMTQTGTAYSNLNAVPGGLLVRPDGKISFPLVGDITAAGCTTGQFTANLTKALAEYIVSPQVTVNIVRLRTTRVYVLGEVLRPGMYELDKQHSLLDAIGVAGGYTQYAAKKEVYVIRSGQHDNKARQKINLLKLLKTGDLSQNVALNEGDVVYLSSSGKIDFARDILPFLTGAYYLDRAND